MATVVTCPNCGSQATRPAAAAGQSVRCPSCGHPMAGQRRRMYLFERAYHDYRQRLRAYFERLASLSGKIWRWFWTGRGSALLEIPLRIGVVLSGVGLALAYVAYERAFGRDLSGGAVAAMIVIAAYVWILAWGLKAPVHIAARASAGAVAVAILAVAAALAAVAGGMVFSVYLLVLLLLTGLSLLVFLPMRGLHGLWLLRRKITYECPYDDCSYQGLPIHICGDCGHAYADLYPSFYGIFHHVCRHGPGQATKLPTMDFLGRNRLQRRCGRCRRPLILSSIGELAERPVFLAGGPSAGKSVFLRQAIRQLCARIERTGLGKARIDSRDQHAMMDRDWRLLDSGRVLPKTVGDVLHAFGLALRLRRAKTRGRKAISCLLYFYDPPGEDFLSMERLGRKHVFQRVSGIVLLVDPFAAPALAGYGADLGDRLKTSSTTLYEVVAELIGVVNQMVVRQANEKCRIPLAVVLNKIDAVPADRLPAFAPLTAARPSDGGEVHRLSRQALEQLGEKRSMQALDLKFADVRYFACSSLGRMPDQRNFGPFEATGVAEPLLWLLGLEGLDDPR